MNKLFFCILFSSMVTFGSYGYNGSTTSAVAIVGGIIKAQNTEISKKYKRKNCPVCVGKGWYISGDKIKKVDCGYCEIEKSSYPIFEEPKPLPSILKSAPISTQQNCPNGNCPSPKQYIRR